jgi:hypothetical protein
MFRGKPLFLPGPGQRRHHMNCCRGKEKFGLTVKVKGGLNSGGVFDSSVNLLGILDPGGKKVQDGRIKRIEADESPALARDLLIPNSIRVAHFWALVLPRFF